MQRIQKTHYFIHTLGTENVKPESLVSDYCYEKTASKLRNNLVFLNSPIPITSDGNN